MNAILIVAHGSRREESNEEIRRLTLQVAEKSAKHFDLIDTAFLELASPLIPEGIQALINKGADNVLVVPYFLARGTHVATDIPAEVAKAQHANPDTEIKISDYLGASDAMPDLLLKLAVSCQKD